MTNKALQHAIIDSGHTQRVIANRSGIHETRLSNLIRGAIKPNKRERRALARILRRTQSELFQTADAEQVPA